MGQRWSRRRNGPDGLPTTLAARRVYILPTRTGLAFAVLLVAMLAAGLNYANGLVLLLCFLLAGVGLAGLHQCHRRLVGLTVQGVVLEPGFAGDTLGLTLQLAPLPGLSAAEYRLSLRATTGRVVTAWGNDDMTAPRFLLRVEAGERGRWALPPLRLSCEAPTGLFRSWVWLHIEAETVVYPRPVGKLPLPGGPEGSGQDAAPAGGHDEWIGLRPFRDGDSPRQVAWKAYARGAPLLSREWRGDQGQRHVFDYAALAGLDREARLSQLAAWVLEAEHREALYALQLPGLHRAAGVGSAHCQDCLRALALHEAPPVTRT